MPPAAIRLLALDGGGVRGLSSLMILKRLMETIDPSVPPKPCDGFDMIGGTSTGGLIAIMLGRLQMTVDECIKAYLFISESVFEKKAPIETIQGKLEEAIKNVLTWRGFEVDMLFGDDPDAPCKVLSFVCATSADLENVCLSTYRSEHTDTDLLGSLQLWEACQATLATLAFYESVVVESSHEDFPFEVPWVNNPIRELWNQAQSVWGPEMMEGRAQCIVSIGAGLPSLQSFRDQVRIGRFLTAVSTEAEEMARQFQRAKASLVQSGHYFRFNIIRGLEHIGPVESKQVEEMATATDRYVGSRDVMKQMQACADSITGRTGSDKYRVAFSLDNIPISNRFVQRSVETEKLEIGLLPITKRRRITVLQGVGGIGKTQLAAHFSRSQRHKFSAVFWVDGNSEDSLKTSLAQQLRRLPPGQVSTPDREYALHNRGSIDAAVQDMLTWLAREDNHSWLLIYDNVTGTNTDSLAYDLRQYFPPADHGSILITTRMERMGPLGDSQKLQGVDSGTSRAIFESWYKNDYDRARGARLFNLLGGIPLAIAQAGAYLQETGASLETYLKLYQQKREEEDSRFSPQTTWALSYEAIVATDKDTANLLLLWSYLGHRDLWYGLFQSALSYVSFANSLSKWLGSIPTEEPAFLSAMSMLRSYSLITDVDATDSYSMHSVDHGIAYFSQGQQFQELGRLAVAIIGSALPENDEDNASTLQRRLIPHVEACFHRVQIIMPMISSEDRSDPQTGMDMLFPIYRLGMFHSDQGKLDQAEEMYAQVLDGCESALGPEHPSTLSIANNLGNLYRDQDKLVRAEQIYMIALEGCNKALGPHDALTLDVTHNLGTLFRHQGRLDLAEQMYARALEGRMKALGEDHISTLQTMHSLGTLERNLGKLEEAEILYRHALQGFEKAPGPDHVSTLTIVNSLGDVYGEQGKLDRAEQMYMRALQGYEKALGPNHALTLDTTNSLRTLYHNQRKLAEAEHMNIGAPEGRQKTLGTYHTSTLDTANNLGNLYRVQGELLEAEIFLNTTFRGYMGRMYLRNRSVIAALNDSCIL